MILNLAVYNDMALNKTEIDRIKKKNTYLQALWKIILLSVTARMAWQSKY